MNIKVQNTSQLKAIISLALSNDIKSSFLFTGELTFSFDLIDVPALNDKKDFKMMMPSSKKSRFIDFENEDTQIFYDQQKAEITICNEDRNLNTEHTLLDEDGFKQLSKTHPTNMLESEFYKTEVTFLTLAGFDLSNGYFDEDYKICFSKNKNLHFAVWGY